jgi:oligosaccharide repeat unit polymerase
MIASKCLALAFSLVILLNAYLMSRIVKTWLFPAVIFALFWFAVTFLPLICLFTVPVNPWSIAFIAIGTIAFSTSALVFFKWRRAFELNRRKPPPAGYFNTPFLRSVFYAASLSSFVCFLLNMAAQGFSLQDLWFRMVETAAAYAQLRYADELGFSIYAKLNLALAYLAVTTGGLLFGCARSRRQAAVVLTGAFLPAVASMLFQSAKGMLFLFVALFVSGILVTRMFAGRMYLIDRATIKAFLLAAAVVIPLTLISFLSRGVSANDGSFLTAELGKYALSYAFGHLYAFSDWFSFHTGLAATLRYPNDPTGYGFYTLMPVFRALGSTREVPMGTYDDYFTYGSILVTNIFTIYRGLITDFGMVGALVYTFVSGFAIHLSFYFLLARRKPVFSIAVFIFAIGYIYMSFAISLLASNSIPFVALALGGCIYANNLRVRLLAPAGE